MLKIASAAHFLLYAVYASAFPVEPHYHRQHNARHQQPLVLPGSRTMKNIEPFSVGATTCAPTVIPNVFGEDLGQYASATAFCSSYIATATTQTVTVTPFSSNPTMATTQAETTQVPVPHHAVGAPESSISSACSCLITSAPTRTATRTVLANAIPTGVELKDALRKGKKLREAKRVELNDVHAGLEARFVRR